MRTAIDGRVPGAPRPDRATIAAEVGQLANAAPSNGSRERPTRRRGT
jgi:hypothetical protein